MSASSTNPAGIVFDVSIAREYEQILTPEALAFLLELHGRFDARRPGIARRSRGAPEGHRRGSAAGLPARDRSHSQRRIGKSRRSRKTCMDRRVEITGPVDRKMVINALNSGAKMFMADFEDSNSPTWDNNISGQINLRDAVRGNHQLHQSRRQAVCVESRTPPCCSCARAAGTWRNATSRSTGSPLSGSLVDFGLYFFHNAKAADRQRIRSVFLFAEDAEPSGGAAVERRVRIRAGLRWRSAGHDSRPQC